MLRYNIEYVFSWYNLIRLDISIKLYFFCTYFYFNKPQRYDNKELKCKGKTQVSNNYFVEKIYTTCVAGISLSYDCCIPITLPLSRNIFRLSLHHIAVIF